MNYTYFVNALHEKYPEINLEIESYKGGNSSGFMKDQLVNGDIPDIYSSNYMQSEELQEQYLLNLSTYDFINNYSDTMLNSVDVDGAIYMLPSRYQVAGINYNKTMFEEHGWEVPQSFEELQALVEQIREEAPEVTPIVSRMSLKGYPFQYFFALGDTEFLGTPAGSKWESDFLEGKATAVGNLEGTAAYLKEWIDAGYIDDTDLYGSNLMSDFYDGKIAMVAGIATSRWTGVGKTTGETIEVGIMAWPGENGNHGMLLSNVSCYYGLSKELAEPGNEQKLEDAIKVLEFISTEEGQDALCSGSRNGVAFPFKNFQIEEDSPLYEVKDYIEEGYTVPLVYEGWEEHLLIPMADEIINLVQGKISQEELLERFDEINKEVQENPQVNDLATLEEDFTQEQAARLSAMAMMDETGADVSLVSLGGITDDGNYLENATGVQCGIHAGGIDEEIVNIFRPNGNQLATIELTGAEINELVRTGRELYADPDAIGTEYTYLEEPVTYYMPYVLTVRNDEPLKENQTYKVVFSAADYSDRIAESWGERLELIDDANSATALIAWLGKLPDGKLSSDDLNWK
jgi:raffinose/stachyose/melibiose transport system substrate-binding protein